MNTFDVPDHTPIIVGGGQSVQRLESSGTYTPEHLKSPMDLAADACRKALRDAQITDAGQIDTIAVVRLFADSAPFWKCPFGGSSNPPESIARRIGATPNSRIYSEVGGTQPQQLVTEMFSALAKNEKQLVLLCGAEAIGNQKTAQRTAMALNWQEDYGPEVAWDDRGYGKAFIANEEIDNGIFLPMYFYSLIENAIAYKSGQNKAEQLLAMGEMFAKFSEIAAQNPYAQFPQAYNATELITPGPENFLVSDPYTKRLVSQDSVNQGAALVLTTVGKARELHIPERHWIHLHGYAEGSDQLTYLRPDVGRSEAMKKVFEQTFAMAGLNISAIDLFDIYSCFPCAVSSACEYLDLPTDGSVPLTLTGGLPFFGGPGNNYSMHGLAEMVAQLRERPGTYGLLTANGGMLSKHAAGIYSTQPAKIDWRKPRQPEITPNDLESMEAAIDPQEGTVVSYMLSIKRDHPTHCSIIAATPDDKRFVATSQETGLLASVGTNNPIGRSVRVLRHNGKSPGKSNLFEFSR